VLLDRWRRRQILVVANLLRAAMVLGVAGLSAADVTGVPLYAAVLACLSVNRFFLAGLSAALPHVVTRAELVMANSVSTTTGTVVAILGGGIGFALKRLFGDGTMPAGLKLTDSRTSTTGVGSKEPAVSEQNGADNQRNRRVTLRVSRLAGGPR